MTSPDLSAAAAQVARRFADANSARLAALPVVPTFFATVASTSPLEVTWRGVDCPVVRKPSYYTPTVGDRVRCSLVRNQLVIDWG